MLWASYMQADLCMLKSTAQESHECKADKYVKIFSPAVHTEQEWHGGGGMTPWVYTHEQNKTLPVVYVANSFGSGGKSNK